MPKSTDLETTQSTEVAEITSEEASLIAANQAEADATEYVIPILKLAQPLTNEVTDGIAKPGEFVLSLTGDSYAPPIEFIVAGKAKGRFRPGKDGQRTLTCYNQPIVPWEEDPLFGTPFAEHPDAEERWRVDHSDDWGSGPPIQTSFNYTGFIIGAELPIPVRLSLRRTSAPAARKWDTILDAALRGRYWDKTFIIGSEQNKNDKGAYYTATAAIGRNTTPEEKQQAIDLAVALRNQQVAAVGDEADTPIVEPDAQGGLAV